MKGYVTINENKKTSAICNCCEVQNETMKLWDVQFTFGSHVDLVKLCDGHLNELKKEIDTVLL